MGDLNATDLTQTSNSPDSVPEEPPGYSGTSSLNEMI